LGCLSRKHMSITSILRQAEIFHGLTPEQLELVAAIAEERGYNADDLLFEQNAASDELYIIGRGEVDIQINPTLVGEDDTAAPITVATLRRGQSFGEIALVDRGVRTAAARCARHDTLLVIIPRDKLMRLCETYPQLGYRLMHNLAADLAAKFRRVELQMLEQFTWALSSLSRL
jgi:CRP/FNR family cyclic AMP-dependent transcriptional regulator